MLFFFFFRDGHWYLTQYFVKFPKSWSFEVHGIIQQQLLWSALDLTDNLSSVHQYILYPYWISIIFIANVELLPVWKIVNLWSIFLIHCKNIPKNYVFFRMCLPVNLFAKIYMESTHHRDSKSVKVN